MANFVVRTFETFDFVVAAGVDVVVVVVADYHSNSIKISVAFHSRLNYNEMVHFAIDKKFVVAMAYVVAVVVVGLALIDYFDGRFRCEMILSRDYFYRYNYCCRLM